MGKGIIVDKAGQKRKGIPWGGVHQIQEHNWGRAAMVWLSLLMLWNCEAQVFSIKWIQTGDWLWQHTHSHEQTPASALVLWL